MFKEFNNKYFFLLTLILVFFLCPIFCQGEVYLVSVKKFGAVADAVKINGKWVGTDNTATLNKCAAYCRKNGFTMFIPKGNYGVSSTVWLTNPELDNLKQSSLTVMGPNKGAYADQSDSAKICVLSNFRPGKIVKVKKKEGELDEPEIVPVLAISNGRQVHIQGLCISGSNTNDLICGIAIGNISMMTSIENCSIYNLCAGLVIAGIKPSTQESVIEGNNDLLVVEQCIFKNVYNIVCAGSQPYCCEYRNNYFFCLRSVFTATLIKNYYGHSRGSHKFSSNIFQSWPENKTGDTVYFDLATNGVSIDSCHFETPSECDVPEILIRQCPNGGNEFRWEKLSFTNNCINLRYVKNNPIKFRPIIDIMMGNRAIFQGNTFNIGTATRIKAYGTVFIGNSFVLSGPYNLKVANDVHLLAGSAGNIESGMYDLNHFIIDDANVTMSLPSGVFLKEGTDYQVIQQENAFKITKHGKAKIDKAGVTKVLISYIANDANRIRFEAWGRNTFNSPHGWRSRNLTFVSNKVIGKTDVGQLYNSELTSMAKSTHKLSTGK